MVGRKGDIVITICQNNEQKSITVESIKDSTGALDKLLGYTQKEIIGTSIKDILSPRIRENIDDYLEFEEQGNDLASVLAKSRDFSMIAKSGEKVNLSMRIQHDVAPDQHEWFVMVVQASSPVGEEVTKMLLALKEREEVDEWTGLANRHSFLEQAEVSQYYVEKEQTAASFAALIIDEFDDIVSSYGEGTSKALLKELIVRCEHTFRQEDILGSLGEGRIGIVLFGAGEDNASIPLNRLRKNLKDDPLVIPGDNNTSVTVSITYKEITQKENIEYIAKHCERSLGKLVGRADQFVAA